MNSKNVTIQEIADKLKKSKSTISRALSDHPTISQKTKKLVRKTVEEMNYSPNSIAASLRKGVNNSIGVVLPKINSHFMSNVVSGIESVLQPTDFNLIICQSNENMDKEARNVQTLLDHMVAGMLISLSLETKHLNHIQKVIKRGIPLVMFDRTDPEIHASSVVNDDIFSSQIAIDHLVEQGYKRIAILCGTAHTSIYQNRFSGYLNAIEMHNLPYKDEWVVKGVITREDGFKAARKLMESSNPPDAIFCTEDLIALGAIQYLESESIRVPEEVGVVGYANDMFSDFTKPSITSVEQFPIKLGRDAAQTLLDVIKDPKNNVSPKTISIRPKLIPRHSSTRIYRED